MAELMDDAEFWLPAKFLTDDDVLMKKGKFENEIGGKKGTELLVSSHGFPSEFPYEFDSFSPLSSPVESVVGSTETESSDEDEFLAGLTRRLAYSTSQKLTVPATFSMDKNEKNGALASSPRSTLSGLGGCWSSSSNGSPNGPSQVPSPPTTPFGPQNDTWDLIYAAAGQVARLKMSNEVPKYTNFNHGRTLSKPQNHSFMKNNTTTNSLYSDQTLPFNQFNGRQVKASNWQAQVQQQHQQQHQHQHQHQIQTRLRNNVVGGRPLGLPQSSWPPLQAQPQQQKHSQNGMRAMFLGGSSGVKRESTGTGVFIPRRYGSTTNTTTHEPRKKSGCSTVLLPAKVVQALNLNFDDTKNHVQPQFNPTFASNYDALVARRNALLTQARRNYRPDGSLNLPQEWTY
ncbi:hypothetical protein ES332_A10G274800v1 [Gossypium tomentosum]|uniref:Uncharacterized protein n=1 Tax=Gossypium tomentosum TaxID=34277 RepID=A0A5D2NVJ1_GOSTO|nr:hypothetical protein ES332_A10G274800v1 [Gossypium tomentosum]